jgi:endonuclease/exonuclease/phosphatase family metal-dependent hydrolase
MTADAKLTTAKTVRKFQASFRAAAMAGLALAVLSAPAVAHDDRNDATVRVMTRNLYFGSTAAAVTGATSFPALVAGAAQVYQEIAASKPAERAAAVARDIARNNVDLVGLQEAGLVRKGPLQLPPNPATFLPATTVVSDQLQLILDELNRLGERYEVVAIVPGFDAQLPTTLGHDARLTTRIAIIARTGRSSDLKLSNVQVQGHLTNSALQTVGGPLSDTRGWASVDVETGGRKFRFATTHLDTNPAIQIKQAHDMIEGAGSTTLPLVFVGDFNAVANSGLDPSFATYQKFINAGFAEAWPARRAPDPGLTCCQASNLLNPASQLSGRVDLVLTKGDIQVVDIKRVGENPSDRTASGLWPSDHAGVIATLKIRRQNGHHH